MRLLVTGTRWVDHRGRPDVDAWLTRWQRRYGEPDLLIVGGASGVDTQAALFALRAGWRRPHVEPVSRAEWRAVGPRAGHDRNQRMVDLCEPGDHCLAFPSYVERSRGTWDCVSRARAAGLAVRVLPPL